MRKIESSGNTDRATLLSSRAEAKSRPKGFSTMTRGMIGQVRGAESFDDRLEERGRDGEIVRRAPSATQRLFYLRERVPVVIVPAHVTELGQKMMERALVTDPY